MQTIILENFGLKKYVCKNCSLSLWNVPEIKIQDKNYMPTAFQF